MLARSILHADMDAFFASVEQRDRPELRGRPVLVGHDGARGVVAAASYEARRFGCRSAQPISVAKRLCPEAVIVGGDMRRYVEASEQIFAIYRDESPLVEPLSIDEAFLDMTGMERARGDPVTVARRIRARVLDETRLTASVGVAPNKFLAKLASDLDKPDGLTVIRADSVLERIGPLPIERLWGVGPATAERVHAAGLRTFADVRELTRDDLVRRFGAFGVRLFHLSRGEDDRPVVPDGAAKSIGQECTFSEDLVDPRDVLVVLLRQADSVGRRLRRSGLSARTLTVKIRYGAFQTITRSSTLPRPSAVSAELRAAAQELFQHWVEHSFRPVRLIGATAGRLQDGPGQLELFGDAGTERERRLDDVVDGIRDRFGSAAIRRGATSERESIDFRQS